MVGTAEAAAVVLDPPAAAVVDDAFAVVDVDESLFLLLEQEVKSRPRQTAPAAMVTRLFIISPVVFVKCSGEQVRDESECAQNEHCCSRKSFCARVAKLGVGAYGKNEIGNESECRQNSDSAEDESDEKPKATENLEEPKRADEVRSLPESVDDIE